MRYGLVIRDFSVGVTAVGGPFAHLPCGVGVDAMLLSSVVSCDCRER